MDRRGLGSSFDQNTGTEQAIRVEAILAASIASVSLVSGILGLYWFVVISASFRQRQVRGSTAIASVWTDAEQGSSCCFCCVIYTRRYGTSSPRP